MNTYISLLRGINVSGQKKIKMAELKQVYVKLGYTNVITYIQSGNVIFQCNDQSIEDLTVQIEAAIYHHYHFEVKVLLKTHKQFLAVLQNNPFNSDQIYVTFLFELPANVPLTELNALKQPSEAFEIKDDIIYFHCPDGYGRTKLSNNFFESKLKVAATTRNWRTVNKLLELSASI